MKKIKTIEKYKGLLKSALMSWYIEKAFFSKDEANVYSDRVINDLEVGEVEQ